MVRDRFSDDRNAYAASFEMPLPGGGGLYAACMRGCPGAAADSTPAVSSPAARATASDTAGGTGGTGGTGGPGAKPGRDRPGGDGRAGAHGDLSAHPDQLRGR